MAQSKIESFSSERYAPRSRNNLGGKLFGDLFSAALTATLVAPSVTVIDRQVVGRLLFWFEMESDQLQSRRREDLKQQAANPWPAHPHARSAGAPPTAVAGPPLRRRVVPLRSHVRRRQQHRNDYALLLPGGRRHDHLYLDASGQRAARGVEGSAVRAHLRHRQRSRCPARCYQSADACPEGRHRGVPDSRRPDHLRVFCASVALGRLDSGRGCWAACEGDAHADDGACPVAVGRHARASARTELVRPTGQGRCQADGGFDWASSSCGDGGAVCQNHSGVQCRLSYEHRVAVVLARRLGAIVGNNRSSSGPNEIIYS